MTDQSVPGGAGLPDPQLDPADAGPPEGTPAWPPTDSTAQPGLAPTEGGAGFGMPEGQGFGAPAGSASGAPLPGPIPAGPGGAPPAGWTPGRTLTPTTGRRGRRSQLIAIGVVVVLLAIVIYAVRNNVAASDLKVGDCFDVPTLGSSVTVKTVQHHSCTEAHTAEVIDVVDYAGSGTTYPGSTAFDAFVVTTCDPAFQAYVGIDVNADPDLTIGYFYPLADGWSNGDRGVTCYAVRVDGAAMTKSLKGSAVPSASP